jgi:hypothetical protein
MTFEEISNNSQVLLFMLFPLAMVGLMSYFGHKRRLLAHQERMAAIEKGLQPPPTPIEDAVRLRSRFSHRTPDYYLRLGLLAFFPGAAMTAFMWLAPAAMIPSDERWGWLLGGIVAAAVGLAYLVFYFFASQQPPQV